MYISGMKINWKSPVIPVLILALLVKLIYLFAGMSDSGSIATLSIDEQYHFTWASAIANGDFLTNAPYFRAPLYPFVLAVLLKISGGAVVIARLFQLLLGLITIFLTYNIGRRLFNSAVGVISGLLLILYPIVTFFEGELLLDSIFALLALTSLYFFLDDIERKSNLPLSGLFFGLAAVARPTILIFAPIVIFILWKRNRKAFTASVKEIVPFFVLVLIPILPITAINYMISGQFTLISYQGGVNFYIGNNPDATGLYSDLPGIGEDWTLDDSDYLAHAETGRQIRYSEQSMFWYNKGLAFVVENPGQFFSLYFKKLYFFFSGYEVSNNRDIESNVYGNSILGLLHLRFQYILALAVLGLIISGTDRRRLLSLGALIAFYAGVISLFFVSSRFRLPVIPLMSMLSAYGIWQLYILAKDRKFDSQLIVALVIGIAVGVFSGINLYPDSKSDTRQELFIRGNQAMRIGNYPLAIACYDSLVSQPGYYKNGYVNRGIAYLKLGDTENSLASFYAELKVNDKSVEALNNLAALYLVNNYIDSAQVYASKALALRPYYKEAAINLLRGAVKDTAATSAVEVIRLQIRPYVEKYPGYLFEEALYFSSLNRISEAIDNHLRLLEQLREEPEVVPFSTLQFAEIKQNRSRLLKLANYQLGFLYGSSGQYDRSIQFSSNAIEVDSLFREAYINLISGYRSLNRHREADSVAVKFLQIWPQ